MKATAFNRIEAGVNTEEKEMVSMLERREA